MNIRKEIEEASEASQGAVRSVFAWLNSPEFLCKFHGLVVWFWVAMLPVAGFTSIKDSVSFLVIISVWALVGAHWGAYQGARGERRVKQNEEHSG